ncbi:translation initiation factor eIF 4e-like domain-containing protein [Mycena floridula]|nr:translation initiation factor eIF 4e-like domain-containing protein [Mycena floridula]
MAEETAAAPAPSRPTTNRLPSLNQLAARINVSATAKETTSAPRPRLAAFALRTSTNAGSTNGSTTSLASTNDSTAVNPPATRSASPDSTASSGAAAGSDGLTSEKLEQLEKETEPEPKPRATKVGYKNIPSLDAITARLAKSRMSIDGTDQARALSIDGSLQPPAPEMIDNPKTPGIPMVAPEHPLQYDWTLYHDTKSAKPGPFTPLTPSPSESIDYEAGLTVVGSFATVESFCRYFNWLKPPSQLEKNSNYHLFKSGIKPMWEDPANENGGKWVLTMKNNPVLLDRCWSWLAMALVGQELEGTDDEICGAVVSLRSKVDRIQVWTRGKEEVEKLNGIGKRLVKLLDIGEGDGVGLEFQFNTDDRPLPNKFLSIQAMPMTGRGPQTPASSTAPGGFGFGAGGAFGQAQSHTRSVSNASPLSEQGGGFGGGAAWRGRK